MLRDVSRCTARPPRRRKDALAPHIESPEVEEADAQQIRTPRSTHNQSRGQRGTGRPPQRTVRATGLHSGLHV